MLLLMGYVISYLRRIPLLNACISLRNGRISTNKALLLSCAFSSIAAFSIFVFSLYNDILIYKIFTAGIGTVFAIPLLFTYKFLNKYLKLYLCIVTPLWFSVGIVTIGGNYGQALVSATVVFMSFLFFRKNKKLKVGVAVHGILLYIIPTIYVTLYGTLLEEYNFPFDELLVYAACLAWFSVVFVIYNNDKTKEFANRLFRKNIELTNTNKLLKDKSSQIEEFAFIITHDLQEPLRNISAIVENLKQGEDPNISSETKLFYNFLESSSKRLTKQVRGLLEFASIGSQKNKTTVDCNKILENVKEDLSLLIEETKAKIYFTGLPSLLGYETELRLLFQNLISNAIKYTKEGETPEVIIKSEFYEDNYLFSVKDNGIGIDSVAKEKIFEIFHRLHDDAKYEGLGLGLTSCKRIVELHKGKIWIDSQPNNGTTFFFTISSSLLSAAM